MKNAFLFCMLIGIHLCLVSCATTTPAPTLTVELYDSRAMTSSGAAPELFLAAPEPIGSGGSDTKEREAPEEEPAPALAASATPEPQAASAVIPHVVDQGFLTPTRPRIRTTGAWALPGAPSVTVPQAAAAVKPVSSATSGKTNGTAARTPSGSGSKAAATASGSASQSGAVAAGASEDSGASQTAQGAAAGVDSYGRLREIYAREGDELQVGLDGTGFLFLGFADTVNKSQGMSFKAKENRNGKTWFVFKALKIGTYDLDFMKQDNANATSTKETVRVHVVSDQEFTTAVSQGQAAPAAAAGAAAEAGDPGFAEKLSRLGSYEAAVAELLKGYREGFPAVNDQIAELYMRMGSHEEAAKFYAKNLAPKTVYTRNAVLGLVRIAIARKDQQGFMSSLKQFLALSGADMEELLIQAARMERDKSEIGVGLDMTAEYAARFPDGAWRDEADFITAQLLEMDSRFRDIARARDLYAGIVKNSPESAFATPSRERLLYIDRHFFQVR